MKPSLGLPNAHLTVLGALCIFVVWHCDPALCTHTASWRWSLRSRAFPVSPLLACPGHHLLPHCHPNLNTIIYLKRLLTWLSPK